MPENPGATIAEHFSSLEDPRMDRTKLHPLKKVMVALRFVSAGRRHILITWHLYKPEQWPGLQTVVMVCAERRVGNLSEKETRYYISSLPSDAGQLLDTVRAHWHIENRLHWVLDATLREDDSRIRTGNAAQNMTVLRHMALNLIKQEQSTRRSVRGKRLKAGWDEDSLAKVLCGN